ncbi:uncharacterized [Tachysurus ichikawai]
MRARQRKYLHLLAITIKGNGLSRFATAGGMAFSQRKKGSKKGTNYEVHVHGHSLNKVTSHPHCRFNEYRF